MSARGRISLLPQSTHGDAYQQASIRAAADLRDRQREQEQRRQQQVEHALAYAAGAPGPLPISRFQQIQQQQSPPTRKQLAAVSLPPADSVLDRHNPTIARVLQMARHLGIDSSSEFYLLPLAVQALTVPDELVRIPAPAGSGGSAPDQYEVRQPDLSIFHDLVRAERLRFRHAPTHADNQPWLKITEAGPAPSSDAAAAAANNAAAVAAASSTNSAAAAAAPSNAGSSSTHSYWFNCKTFHRAPAPPASTAGSSGSQKTKKKSRSAGELGGGGGGGELSVMRFTSGFLDPSGARRVVKIAYHLAAEEFEITIVAPPSSQNSGSSSSSFSAWPPASLPPSRTASSSAVSSSSSLAASSSLTYRVKSLRTKHGPASCWDLHIGATIDLFGKQTTLTGCEHATREWIETNAKRLREVRALLARKLAKFTPARGGGVVGGGGGLSGSAAAAQQAQLQHLLRTSVDAAHAGPPLVECHLRALMKDVSALKSELAKFRPALADKYAL